MKKILICAALCFIVCNITVRIVVSANSEAISVKSFLQYNSGSNSYNINASIKSGETAYTVVRLTKDSSLAGKKYRYILWTEKPLSDRQAQQLIDYVASRASGNLSGITFASTLLASGSGYTWYAAGGSRDYMTFARKSFFQSAKSLSSSMAAGGYTTTGAVGTTVIPTLPVQPSTTGSTTVAATTKPVTAEPSTTTVITAPTIVIETVTSRPGAGATMTSAVTTTAQQTSENPTTMPPIVIEPATSLPNTNETMPPLQGSTTAAGVQTTTREEATSSGSTGADRGSTIPECGS